MVPSERCDLGKLQPVETISIYMENGQTVVEVDTGAIGKGETLTAALEDMKQSTSGVIYLDTADYVLVRRETEGLIPEIREYLKGAAKICRAHGSVKVEEAASYLSVHRPDATLKNWKAGDILPFLRVSDGRVYLDEK